MTKDPRLHFDATSRNANPILGVLKSLVGAASCDVLEIASGSGQHAVHMTAACPNLRWWPTDLDPAHIQSIDAWRAASSSPAIQKARILDVTSADWRRRQPADYWPSEFDGIININMIHIAPWAATTGLLEGAARWVRAGGFVYFYGPFKQNGVHTAPSNHAFDDSLRSRNPNWGIRDVEDVKKSANENDLILESLIEMPANNLSLVFRKLRPDNPGRTM